MASAARVHEGAHALSLTIRFFICGSALRGQPDHAVLEGATFLREVLTAPRYRIHSVKDAHPAVYLVERDGVSVAGELYELTAEQHERLLAQEPPGLYEDDVVFEDGSTARAMLFPRAFVEERGYADISSYGGWAAYRASQPEP
jgi:gamma-glutamylaminecyclotransferase